MSNRNKYMKMWRSKHPKYNSKYNKKWQKNNPEYMKQWQKNNPEYMKQYLSIKYKVDWKFNLSHKIKIAINISLKGDKTGRHWENLVGYSLIDLIRRLQKTMPEGYTWQDYLAGKLHIDHIIPISAFNFSKPEHTDFKRCWALKNLQLLPAKENRTKHNKLTKSFQPALKLIIKGVN